MVVTRAGEDECVAALAGDADRQILHWGTVKRCRVVSVEGEASIVWVSHYRCDVDRVFVQIVRCFHTADSAG